MRIFRISRRLIKNFNYLEICEWYLNWVQFYGIKLLFYGCDDDNFVINIRNEINGSLFSCMEGIRDVIIGYGKYLRYVYIS